MATATQVLMMMGQLGGVEPSPADFHTTLKGVSAYRATLVGSIEYAVLKGVANHRLSLFGIAANRTTLTGIGGYYASLRGDL